MANPNIWAPGEALNANSSVRFESFTASSSQSLFTLTDFQYAIGTGSLLIFVSGIAQRPGIDFYETSVSSFTLSTPVAAGTIVLAMGMVEVSAILDQTFVVSDYYVAVGGETIVSWGNFQYELGGNHLRVFRNGLLQEIGYNYTETSESSVTFLTALDADDRITFLSNVFYTESEDGNLRGDLLSSGGSDLVGFKQDGAGAVTRTVESKVKEFVSVKDFGAVGDFNGTTGTDDFLAIQSAIDYLFSRGGGTLYFPVGKYRITSPLNLTGDGTLGRYGNTPIVFRGEGMPNAFDTGSWDTYGGSWIVGQTGNWIVDATGLQYFSCEEMGFRGTGANASTLGILQARSTVVKFAHSHNLKKVVVWLDTAPAASSIGSIAVANNGAETYVMEHCWLVADTPLALTFNNSLDLTLVSPYVTIDNSPVFLSSTMMNFRNNTFIAHTGYATHIQGIINAFFDTCIWTASPGNTTIAGIHILSGQNDTAHCQDLRFTGQVEQFSRAARISDPFVWNLDFNLMMPNPTAAYISTGLVEMNNCKINIHAVYGSTPQYIVESSFATKMQGGEIVVYAGSSVSANTNLILYGTHVKGAGEDVSGSLGVNVSSTYIATGQTGTTIVQPAALLITPNAGNNATSAAAPNGLQSYLMSDGTIQLAGTFVPNGATTIAAGVLAGTIAAAHRPNREVDSVVYISGVLYYLRIQTDGSMYLGGAVVGGSGQTANIDCVRYRQFN